MENEEILGRCAICDYISTMSDVERHVAEIHDTDDNSYYENSQQQISEEDSENIMPPTPDDKVYWPKTDVKVLIDLYKKYKNKFEDKRTTNKSLWKQIAEELRLMTGKSASAEQCENKFKNLKKTYKKIVDNNRASGRGAVNWPYFTEMADVLGKQPEIVPLAICSSLEGPTVQENRDVPNNPTTSRKRKSSDEEPAYFKKFRAECQKRHEEKMERQDKFLSLLEKLVDKL